MLSCYAFFPLHLLEPLKDGWTDFLQGPSITGISLKNPLSKGTARHPKPLSSLKKICNFKQEGDGTLYQAWERPSLKNLETQIEQLKKEFHSITASEVNNLTFDQCMAVYVDKEAPLNNTINKSHEVSFVQEEGVSSKVLPCQLPPKELNLGNFTLPCTIGSLKFYVMADLGMSINVIPKSMNEHLKLSRLKKTDMLVEMADMTKRAPIGIVETRPC
ncbi:reverse transcriptase domain-containing protein [Tanacetum coccineum]